MLNSRIKKILNKIFGWLKEDSFRNLINNVGSLLIGDTGASLINMLSLVVMLKIIGTENYGIIVLIQAYSLTIDQLFNFQSWQAFIKYGAEALEQKNHEKFKGILKQGTILDLGTALLGTLVAMSLIGVLGTIFEWNSYVIEYGRIYSITILFHFSGVPTGVLRLFNKFKLISFQKIIVSIIKLIGILIAFILDVDFIMIIWINLVCDILGHILLVVFSNIALSNNNITNWLRTKVKFNNQFISFAIWSNLSSTLTVPSKRLDVFIVSSVLSLEMVGVYKVFKQVASIFSRLVTPVYQSIYPELANIVAKGDYNKAIKTATKITIIITAFLIPVIIIGGGTSPFWLDLFFGSEVSEFWIYFIVFLIFVGVDAATAPVHPLFNALGYVKQKFFIMGIGNIVYLILAWILGENFGLIGIISAWGSQFIIITTLKVIYIKQRQNIKAGEANARN